jgi:hypothetical protein
MTWNPHDPNKPGGYTDWKLHGEKYGNYGSSLGQHGTSPISKPNAVTPFSSSSSSASSPVSSFASKVFTGGGSYSDAGSYLGGRSSGSSGSLIGGFFGSLWSLAKTMIVVGAVYGAFDGFVYRSTVDHSMDSILRTEAALSAGFGGFIVGFNPSSPWLALANKGQSEAGFGLALCAMVGAAFGNGAVDLARQVIRSS